MRSRDLTSIRNRLGWDLYWFGVVGSTQDLARRVLRDGPVVVGADEQTQGRGRFGRSWWSPKGGLYLSIGIKEACPAEGLLGALATAKGIELETQLPIHIRWPNDLIIGGYKVAGVLCESSRSGTILGIGVNLNQEEFPEELQGTTSLAIELGRKVDRRPLLLRILQEFKELHEMGMKGDSLWLEEFKARLVGLNQEVRVELGRRHLTGILFDLDEAGRLVLRTQSGRLVVLSSGQVQRLR